MRHRRPHHPRRRLLELLEAVPLGGWRRKAAEEEEGGRQGRQLGVRGRDALDSVLTSCRLVFEPSSGAAITIQPLDGHQDVFLVSSASRSSPRRPFCPFRLLALPPEERDKKGITGTLSLFNL